MNYSMSGRIDKCGEVSRERTQQPFPFLRLPGEIRNEIYRLLLLTQNVTTVERAASQSFGTPGDVASVQPGEVAVGTIRGKCWWTYTMRYQIAIILTNRKIYREAWGIFQLENFWTLVDINKAGFAKEMKDRNFPVAIVSDDFPCRQVKFPVMSVMVTFPSLVGQKQSDTFVVPTAHLRRLVRALWTAKGASEMLVAIHVSPPRIKKSPCESSLLRPFFKLRSIKRLLILGVSKRDYADRLTRAITTTDGIDQIFIELTASVKRLRRYIEAKQWRLAIALETIHSDLMDDCLSVYGYSNRFNSGRAFNDIYTATTISNAEIDLYSENYTLAICCADHSLILISMLQNFNPVPPTVVPPYHQLLSPAGSIASENEIKCKILLIRARACMATRQPERAFSDIEEAREIMPNSETVASISEAWQAMFCYSAPSPPPAPPPPLPPPPPPPPPTASYSTALTTTFADVTNNMAVDNMDADNMDVDSMDIDNMDLDNMEVDNMDVDHMDVDHMDVDHMDLD